MDGCSLKCVALGAFVKTVLWLGSHVLSSKKNELSPSHRMGYLRQ